MAPRLRGNDGFTLLELMIAVVIIGCITALVAPRFLALQGNAWEDAVVHDLRSLMERQETYSQTNNTYADDIADPALAFTNGNKVVVTIEYATQSDWVATGYYLSRPNHVCALAMGENVTTLLGYISGKVECTG